MGLDVGALTARLRQEYPGRDWRGRCQQLVWNVVWLTGTPEDRIVTYPMASDAYRASQIVSTDPDTAPEGAVHYWANPDPEGHVAVALGGGQCFMASGQVGGDGLGVIGVRDYTARAGNPYLGWSYLNGANRVTVAQTDAAVAAPNVWEDDMLIYQIVDWDNRCYLITAAGHAYVGSPGAVGAWSKATGRDVAPVSFGDFFELAKSVNDAAAAGVLASKGDVKNVSSDVITEAQKRGLIPA